MSCTLEHMTNRGLNEPWKPIARFGSERDALITVKLLRQFTRAHFFRVVPDLEEEPVVPAVILEPAEDEPAAWSPPPPPPLAVVSDEEE